MQLIDVCSWVFVTVVLISTDMIVDEEIDGDSYLGLTESILTNMLHLKAGHIVKILRHVNSCNMMVS